MSNDRIFNTRRPSKSPHPQLAIRLLRIMDEILHPQVSLLGIICEKCPSNTVLSVALWQVQSSWVSLGWLANRRKGLFLMPNSRGSLVEKMCVCVPQQRVGVGLGLGRLRMGFNRLGSARSFDGYGAGPASTRSSRARSRPRPRKNCARSYLQGDRALRVLANSLERHGSFS